MSEEKHTPGVWRIDEQIVLSGSKLIAVAYGDDPNCKADARMEANARLIAAAPELLEALRWYVETDEVSEAPGNEFWLEGRERALAAIAKATGETK